MKKAFTLVEVLITVLLLTLLMATAMFSFRFFIKRVDSLDISLPRDAMSYEYLNHSIYGIYFYPVKEVQNYKKIDLYFFKHTKDSFTYITTTPIYYDKIAVAQVKYEDNKLYYYESKLYTKEQDYKNPRILNNSYKKLLKKNIEKFEIHYSFYEKIKIPKNIELQFTTSNKWIFAIYSNNLKYKFILNQEES